MRYILITRNRETGVEKGQSYDTAQDRVVALGEIDVHQYSFRFVDAGLIDPVDQDKAINKIAQQIKANRGEAP